MHRFPKGLAGDKVHQKRVPSGAPPWLETVRVHFPRYGRGGCVRGVEDRSDGRVRPHHRTRPVRGEHRRITAQGPYGGEGTGPNPTDRGKLAWKWSVASERHGVPIGWAIDGANRNDVRMLEPTIEAVAAVGLLVDVDTLHLDRGYDYPCVKRVAGYNSAYMFGPVGEILRTTAKPVPYWGTSTASVRVKGSLAAKSSPVIG